MEQKQIFSAQTLTLSVAAAELGRAIFGTGQTGSVRAVLLSNVLAAAAFVLLAALASVNASRLNRPGFAGKCICAVFLLWYLFELVRTAAMLQQACWEQFASMAFIGLLPFFLWAGWSLGCELYDRMASVLGWLVVLGIVFCVLGLAGQLQWQVLVTGETAHSFVLPDATFYPEYFSFPLLCMSKNNAKISKKPIVWLPIIAAVISSGYALGLALLFGAPQAYPGYELLRAWSFGGISRFDAAFLLLWLAAAIFRFGFIVRAVRLLCERLASVNASRLNRPGFAGKCICAVFLLWYLFELVRTAAMLQQACWEQFASMAFIGLLPFFLWAGWSLGCELYDRMASVLGWLVVLGIVFCVLGLAGQLQWQVLVTGETAHSFVLPDATFYPEYFSFPLLCMSKNNAKISKKPIVWLPIIAAVISSGYALGLALLFGAPQAYPGYELLRAWSFGGISRFDAAFLLLWLAAAIFRFGFIVRAVRLLCERLAEGPVNAEAAR